MNSVQLGTLTTNDKVIKLSSDSASPFSFNSTIEKGVEIGKVVADGQETTVFCPLSVCSKAEYDAADKSITSCDNVFYFTYEED